MTDAEPPAGERPDLPNDEQSETGAEATPAASSGQHSSPAPSPWSPPETEANVRSSPPPDTDTSSFGAYPPPIASSTFGVTPAPAARPAYGELAPPALVPATLAPPAYGERVSPELDPGAAPPPYGSGPVPAAPDTVRLGDHEYVRASYLRAPEAPPQKKALGLVAMIAAFVVFAISVPVSVWVGLTMGPHATHTATGFTYRAPAAGLAPALVVAGLAIDLQLLVGTAAGLWALIQGIVATAKRRGRAYGITAIVVAAAAPVFSLIAFVAALAASLPPR